MHQKVPVLLLHPPIVPLCEDSILNAFGSVGREPRTLFRAVARNALDETDGADGDEIVLLVRLGVVFF